MKESKKNQGVDTRDQACQEASIALILSMKERWKSAWVARSAIREFTGGLYSPGFLANCDSQQVGPKGAFRVKRGIVYPVTSLCDWLVLRLEKAGGAFRKVGKGDVS